MHTRTGHGVFTAVLFGVCFAGCGAAEAPREERLEPGEVVQPLAGSWHQDCSRAGICTTAAVGQSRSIALAGGDSYSCRRVDRDREFCSAGGEGPALGSPAPTLADVKCHLHCASPVCSPDGCITPCWVHCVDVVVVEGGGAN
jgi:hypothetical protein